MKLLLISILSLFVCAFTYAQTVFTFNTPGITTFTVPAGCHTKITVAIYGAGGGGGGSNVNNIGGGGGGAGGFAQAVFFANPGDVFAIEVGAGGIGGNPVTNGGSGGFTKFDGGTLFANGGQRGFNENAGGAGGTGGIASNWCKNYTGTAGGNGINPTGGSGGDNLGPVGGIGGAGGAATFDGANGAIYGAGGGGGGKMFAGDNSFGGNGADGAIIITLGGIYISTASGAWTTGTNWDSNVIPPHNLRCGDFVIINHDITFTTNKRVLGTYIINAGASLVGSLWKKIEVGKGGTNLGSVENYGTLTATEIKCEPDACLVPVDPFPVINNYSGGVINSVKIDIGKGCESGSLYNFVGGKINVSVELHIDGYMCNQDSVFVGTKLKIHGGTVDCCGFVETPRIEFSNNSGRPGTSLCQQYCTNLGLAPTILVDGTVYPVVDLYTNPDPTEGLVDPTTTFCSPFALPVELVSFNATSIDDRKVLLEWTTANELNNDYFTVERSIDGDNWEFVATIDGAGNSNDVINYSIYDPTPYPNVSFYRLKQTDFDGTGRYSDIVAVSIDASDRIVIYPNPTNNDVTMTGEFDINEIRIINLLGQDVSNTVVFTLLNENVLNLDMRSLKAGMYIIMNGHDKYSVHKL